MKYLIIYSLAIFGIIYCDDSAIDDESRAVNSQKNVGMTLNHPAQNGYQTVLIGSDKHKYGYEIKHQASGKHFHHTSTEKDGVRLGCYGYELEGKKYLTQYVADVKGYRLVTNEDLITVHPKSGRTGKAVFAEDFGNDEDDAARSSGVRYVFPKGCKGIDVQIDNSSRLRSLLGSIVNVEGRNMEISPRLPVHYPNRSDVDKYNYYNPSNSYPGPSHIYAQSQQSSSSYVRPSNSYARPTQPSNSYARPSTNKPVNSYIPPNPPSTYLPPYQTQSTTKKPDLPNNTYLPPNPSQSINTIPSASQSSYNINNNQNIATGLVPPKEEQEEATAVCQTQSECCDESSGKLVIPIPLKNRNSNDCCSRTAKLVIPLTHFDSKAAERLKEAFTKEEFDVDNLIRSILGNL